MSLGYQVRLCGLRWRRITLGQRGGRRKAEEGEGDRRGRDKDREREERRGGRGGLQCQYGCSDTKQSARSGRCNGTLSADSVGRGGGGAHLFASAAAELHLAIIELCRTPFDVIYKPVPCHHGDAVDVLVHGLQPGAGVRCLWPACPGRLLEPVRAYGVGGRRVCLPVS